MAAQFGRGGWRALALQVAGSGHQDGVAGYHLARDDIAVERRISRHQRDVEVFDRHLAPGGHLDVQRDLWVGRTKTLHQRCQHVRGQHRCRRQTQYAGRCLGVHAGHAIGFVDVLQDGAHPRHVGLSGLAQRDAARGAVKQARAQVLLQVGHQPGDHGRRHLQRARGGGKAPFIDHALKDTHRKQTVHFGLPEISRP